MNGRSLGMMHKCWLNGNNYSNLDEDAGLGLHPASKIVYVKTTKNTHMLSKMTMDLSFFHDCSEIEPKKHDDLIFSLEENDVDEQ